MAQRVKMSISQDAHPKFTQLHQLMYTVHNKYIHISKKVWRSHVSAMLMNHGSGKGDFPVYLSDYLTENEGMHSEQNNISGTQSAHLLHVLILQTIITKKYSVVPDF